MLNVPADNYLRNTAPTIKPSPAASAIVAIGRSRSDSHGIADLAGKRVNVGRLGSGAFATWSTIETALDWKNGEKTEITDLGPVTASNALCAGEIDASLLVVGHPSGTVQTHLSACATNFVAVTGPEIDALVSSAPYLRKGSIPAPLYGLAADTPTIGPNAVVMTSESETAAAVTAFAQATIARISDLRTKHPALANLTLEEMTGGSVPTPLHPAASRVYEDLGLLK